MTPPKEKINRARAPEILDAATDAFSRQGYANTSVQDIADAVGLLKGSLYYYIDSKEDLLFAILDDVNTGALQMLEEVEAYEGRAIDRLRRLIEMTLEYNIKNLKRIAVYNHDYDLLSPERREVIVQQRRRYEAFVIDQIDQAKADGDVDPGINSKLAAYFLLGAVNWVYVWYRPSRSVKSDYIGRLFSALAIGGLTGAEAPEAE